MTGTKAGRTPKDKFGRQFLSFLHSSPNDYRLIKGLLGFPTGLLYGFGLYFLMLRTLQLPLLLDRTLATFCLLVCGTGFAFSAQARCFLLLLIPTLFGKSGRSYIGTFALAYLLAGPVSSIIYNAQEVTRSIGCSAELAQSMTKERMKLRLKPLHNIMKDLQQQAVRMHQVAEKAYKSFLPVQIEIEGDDSEMAKIKQRADQIDSKDGGASRTAIIDRKYAPQADDTKGKQMEKKMNRKLDYRCEDIFSIGVSMCEKKFKKAYDECKGKIKLVGAAVCVPLKLDALCKLVRVLGKAGVNCNAMDATNPGFGEHLDTANDAAEAMEKNFEVNMQYKVVRNMEKLSRLTADDVAQAINYEFQRRKQWILLVTTLIQRALAFMFLRVLWSAYSYNHKYATDFRHDNVYLTDYFKRIDARRGIQSKTTLLPLKKTEKKSIVTTTSLKMAATERSKLVSSTLRLIFRVVAFGMIAFVDKLIYEVLDIIKRHSRITYKQTGEHHIDLRVHGSGMMGQLVKSLISGFSQHHNLDQNTSNFRCLPEPTRTPSNILVKILIVFITLQLLLTFEAYGLRLRRSIAAFFYPKREKKRILFLYNDMLKKRKGYLKHMRHVIKRKAKDDMLEAKQGTIFCWIEKITIKKRTCLICEESEDKTFYRCLTPRCQFVYCRQCWRDIEFCCYACRDEDQWTTTDSSDELELD